MDSSTLLGITTFTYLLSTIFYICLLLFKGKFLGKLATSCAVTALVIETFALALRWLESYELGIGHAPLTNMYESLIFFAWTLVFLYLVMERKFKIKTLGAFALPVAFLAMAYASLSDDVDSSISPLIPALQSNWLISHVATCFIGYASFAIAAGLSIMFLLKHKKAGIMATLPNMNLLDDFTHKTIIFGFIWLSAGIITGAVWANSAWGSYWSWDPKETWALITWFVYAITLHTRYRMGWRGTRTAWLSILGFVSVLFTYYGVNYFLSGLHSYGAI